LAAQSGLTVGHDCAEAAARFVHDIVYCGLVPAEALPDYFARADVAIYPFDDTLVNRAKCAVKLRDLLAAGVPVVAEAVGQNREMVRHTETGWLVEPGDVPVFGDAVVRLLGDEGLRLRLAEAATHDMRERFGWERLVGIVEQALGDEGDQGA
jgi:glycosyltransferase involved in cell wall biosynthesis